MRRTITRALIVYVTFLGQPGAVTEREALAHELRNAWLPLESGLTVTGSEGTPISAKYEIDNGAFLLSVYTMRGDTFSEVRPRALAAFMAGVERSSQARR
jgi:hypothetical protein